MLNSAGSVVFCTVVDLSRRPRNTNETEPPKPDPSKWDHEEWAHVSLKLLDGYEDAVGWAAEWYRTSGNYIIVEFLGVLLPAFEHTLKALQKIEREPNMPFSDLIVPKVTGDQVRDVSPPQYAQRPGFRFNLKCLTKYGDDFFYSPTAIPDPEALSRLSQLDTTQCLALLNSLRRCISLTECPPGTGKSYMGGALIRTLIQHKNEANLGPIICVTYTNHALDQVLEHLHQDGVKNIIRIGSRSQSEVLSNVNLRTVAKDAEKTKKEKYML